MRLFHFELNKEMDVIYFKLFKEMKVKKELFGNFCYPAPDGNENYIRFYFYPDSTRKMSQTINYIQDNFKDIFKISEN